MQMATMLTVSEAHTDGPEATGEVREGLPGSTLERGMCVEKRQELGRPRGFPNWSGDPTRRLAWHAAIESTHGETLTQVGRSLNGGNAAFKRQIG